MTMHATSIDPRTAIASTWYGLTRPPCHPGRRHVRCRAAL